MSLFLRRGVIASFALLFFCGGGVLTHPALAFANSSENPDVYSSQVLDSEAVVDVGFVDDHAPLHVLPTHVATQNQVGKAEVVEFNFEFPAGCKKAGRGLKCDGERVTVTPLVFDSAGETVAATVKIKDGIHVRAKLTQHGGSGGELEWPLVGSALIAADGLGNLNKQATDAVTEMFEEPYLPTTNTTSSGKRASAASASASTTVRPPQVTVPADYRYCPDTCKPKVLHDYCSYSPDSHVRLNLRAPVASFQGPCARHDMGIDAIRVKDIALSDKRAQRSDVDVQFRNDLRQNCTHFYYDEAWSGERGRCYTVAGIYYMAVSLATKTWGGN